MKIRIAITGRSYHLAEPLGDEMTLPDAASVSDALSAITEKLAGEQLPSSCLLAVSGDHLGTVANYQDRPLSDGDELALIAPVAGG